MKLSEQILSFLTFANDIKAFKSSDIIENIYHKVFNDIYQKNVKLLTFCKRMKRFSKLLETSKAFSLGKSLTSSANEFP